MRAKSTFVLLFGLLISAPAFAQGDRRQLRDQIRTILSDYRAAAAPLRDQIVECGRTYLAGIETALQLDEAQLDALEIQLDAAQELAEARLEALPEADQTLANARTILLEELKKVTDAATADAALQAQLDTLSAAFADCILPLKQQLADLRAQARAAILALLGR